MRRRRRAHRLALAAGAVAGLSACGGSGFSGDGVPATPSVVVLATDDGRSGEFFIAPGGTSPLAVNAVSYAGSGAFATIVSNVTYTWSARFVDPSTDPPSVSHYSAGTASTSVATCASVAATAPVPVLVDEGGGTASAAYPGYRDLGPRATATTVFLGAVPGVPAPYCLLLQATSVPGGTIGTATVVVSTNP